MANPIFGFLIFPGLFWASKQIPFQIPQVFLGMRIAYGISTVLVLLIYSYTKGSIDGSRDTTVLTHGEAPQNGKDDNSSISVQEYDRSQWKTLIKGFCMSLVMMSVMHLYMGMPGPLFINMVVPLRAALGSELVQIHLFGKHINRPFPEPDSIFKILAAARAKLLGGHDKTVELKQE